MSEAAARTSPEEGAGEVLREARQAIERLGPASYAEELLEGLATELSWLSDRVLARLGELPEAEGMLPTFAAALRDGASPARRNGARAALATLASPGSSVREAASALLAREVESSDDPDVRLLAATTIGETGNVQLRPSLERALGDAAANVRAAAAEALGALGDPRAVPALAAHFAAADFWTRASLATALGRIGDRRALPVLAQALREPMLRALTAHALGELGIPEAIPLLRGPLAETGEVRTEALNAIARIYDLHSRLEIPPWLRAAVAAAEGELTDRALRQADPRAARLLGIAATPSAIRSLLELLRTPFRRPVAASAFGEVPDPERVRWLIPELEAADSGLRTAILELLPSLEDRAALAAIAAILGDPDPETRAAAAEVLRRSARAPALELLLEALGDPERRAGAALAIGRLDRQRCAPLLELLEDPDPEIRAAAAEGLAHCGAAELPLLIARLRNEHVLAVREALISALGRIGGEEPLPYFAELLREESPAIRYAAAVALGDTREPAAIGLLEQALSDPLPEVRIAALHSLGDLGGARATRLVRSWLNRGDRELRRTASYALGQIEDAEATIGLLESLDDTDREVRLTAIESLRRIGGGAVLPSLAARLDREIDPEVRRALARAWMELNPEPDTIAH